MYLFFVILEYFLEKAARGIFQNLRILYDDQTWQKQKLEKRVSSRAPLKLENHQNFAPRKKVTLKPVCSIQRFANSKNKNDSTDCKKVVLMHI